MNTWRKKAITFAVFMAWVTKGLYLEALGPAMIDLKLIYNTNYESITRAVAGRGAGGFIGALLGAWIVDRFEDYRELFMAIFTTVAGLCVAVVVDLPSVDHVWLLYCVIGGSSVIVNMAGTKLSLEMWKTESPPILQLLHMGFGVGALIGPLLCSPFLAVVESQISDQNQESHFKIIKESHAREAFVILGVITVSVAVPFYMFHFTRAKDGSAAQLETTSKKFSAKQSSFIDLINPATYANGNFGFGLCMYILLSVYFFSLIGGEKVYGSFVRTIAVDIFKLGKLEASYLNSAFWVSLTVGRLVGYMVARHVNIHSLLLGQVLANLVSIMLIYMCALTSAKLFWLLTMLEGFIVAPLYPLGIAYGDSQINLSGFCLMIVTFTGSFGDMTYLWAGGKLYDTYGPRSTLLLATIASWSLVVSIVIFRCVTQHCVSKNR